MNIPTISLAQFAGFLTKYLKSGDKLRPIAGWGPVGTGKTSVVKQVAEKLELKLIDVRASQLEPVDVRGIPEVVDHQTDFALPRWLPNVERDGERGILCLDEFHSAMASVQTAFYSLLQERVLGDYTLPDGWTAIILSNRPEDGASVHGRIDSAIANRYHTQFNLLPEINSFTDWAFANGIDPLVIGFLQFKEELLHQYPNGGIPKGETVIATPRSWASVGDTLALNLDPVLEQAALEGGIGPAPAAEFVAFKRLFDLLPDWKDCFSDPDNAPIPADVSTQYAIISQLSNKVGTGDQFEAGARYASRMSDELVQVFIRLVVTRDDTFKATSTYINQAIANQ
tara:strand:- start:4674 stop:5696 length:1023 start_codon:yes stop_codon:yes gene_type:complete